jgi:hypothetical protein
MKYSKGICWLDDTRIPTNWEEERPPSWFNSGKSQSGEPTYGGNLKSLTTSTIGERLNTQGRFTPNLLVCDDMLNDGKTYGNLFKQNRNKDVDGGTGNSLVRAHKQGESNGIFDNGTSSSRFYDLDKWFDKIIDNL